MLFGGLERLPGLLLAVSGGPDSTALLLLAARWAKRLERAPRLVAVTIDHGLRREAAAEAAAVKRLARALRVPHRTLRWRGAKPKTGLQEAARLARYRLLARAARQAGFAHVVTAHTLDDQAETVLLGLARGSGAASLQGMAPVSGRYLRPLLGIRRAATHRFCADSDLVPWLDPQNAHSAYTRVRVRQNVMPVLEAELGPGVAEALARTAEQLREDSDAFQTMIDEVIEDLVEHSEAGISVSVPALEANPVALQGRIVRFVVQSEFGVALERVHVRAILALVADWHGQKPLDLPGFTAARTGGRLVLSAAPASSAPDRP